MFDYKGFSEEKLIELCDDKNVDKGKAEWKYWPSEVYSFGRHYRRYGFYPSFLPLYVYSDHGVGNTKASYHELKNDAEATLFFSLLKVEDYKKQSNKPCYLMINPFVWYRKHNNIQPVENAKGTLAFPAHSTPAVSCEFDVLAYINTLKNLPEEMQPVCVCLHMHDIHKGLHKIFLDNNMPVYTAGNAFDKRFAERYYNIIIHFKYTTSNLIGSYTFYSIESGIPFSLLGNECKYYNLSDPNLEKGEYQYKKNENYIVKEKLFSGIQKEITPEQKQYVESFVNAPGALSRLQTAKVLYSAYFKRADLLSDSKKLIKYLSKKINKIIFCGKIKNIKKAFLFSKKKLRKLSVSPLELYRLIQRGSAPAETKFLGKKIKVNSAFWYLHGLKELFVEENYRFHSEKRDPLIYDCGANTGLSILYFKHLYPEAKIVAFEPDENIFSLMKENLQQFNYTDIEYINKAVWNSNDPIKFLAAGGVSGRICDETDKNVIEIPAIRLRDMLDQEVDFLKIDIEGSEYEVLKDCADKLKNVQNLFVEYHSEEKNEQKLDEILKIIKEAGFKYYLKEAWPNQLRPYVNKRVNLFDLQLNIFAYRI